MADPLAGQREAINEGDTQRLLWLDVGQPAPVEDGEIFKLRTCHIEITRVHRARVNGKAYWRAEFTRSYPEGRLYLLDRRGGYTEDQDAAIRAQDDPGAPTIDAIDQSDRSEAHRALGEPPEPEAIPPHEVATLPSTVAARLRFEQQRREDITRRQSRSLLEELREAKLTPEEIDRIRGVLVEIHAERQAVA